MPRLALAPFAIVAALACAPAAAQPQPGWEVRVPERVELAAGGEPGTLSVAIAVDRGLVVSKDGPVIVDLTAPPGLVKKARLGRADAVDPGADAPRFAIALKPPADAGEHVVKLRVRCWICGARACRPVDLRRQVTVAVVGDSPHLPNLLPRSLRNL